MGTSIHWGVGVKGVYFLCHYSIESIGRGEGISREGKRAFGSFRILQIFRRVRWRQWPSRSIKISQLPIRRTQYIRWWCVTHLQPDLRSPLSINMLRSFKNDAAYSTNTIWLWSWRWRMLIDLFLVRPDYSVINVGILYSSLRSEYNYCVWFFC